MLFESCISVAPITLPSHASILTGLYPFTHGARNNGTHQLPAEVRTLAELLGPQGVATGAVVSAMVLDHRYGLDQGFEVYDDDLSAGEPAAALMFRETAADDTAARALRWLESHAAERWFLWVHFFDPHVEYRPPEPYASRFADAPYDGEIAFADAALGELIGWLERRGQLDRTLVAMTSDHGESLGEHGESTHGVFLYDATTRVPLVLSHPALAQGARVREVVSVIDIAPTVLELLGSPAVAGLDGRSLAATCLRPEHGAPPAVAYSEAMVPRLNYGWSELRALRDGSHRYVRAPRPELYELAADPRETRNLYSTASELASSFERRLAELIPGHEADAQTAEVEGLDPAVRRSLEALGYAFSAEAEREDAEQRSDPKDRMQQLARREHGIRLVDAGELARAEEIFRELVELEPDSMDNRDALAGVLSRMGRIEDALGVLRESVARGLARGVTLVRIAEIERRLGLADWQRHLVSAQSIDPLEPLAWVRQGDLVHFPGDLDAARAAYEHALGLDVLCAEAWVGLGNVEFRSGRLAEADQALNRAVAADPRQFAAWFNLGIICKARGELARAIEGFGRAAELEPRDIRSRLELGRLHHHRREFAQAASAFASACELAPREERAWEGRMLAYRAVGDFAATLEAATALLELRTGHVTACITAAVAARQLGREREAREYLRKAFALDGEAVREAATADPQLKALVAESGERGD